MKNGSDETKSKKRINTARSSDLKKSKKEDLETDREEKHSDYEISDFSDDEMDISDRTNIEQAQEKVILISQRYIYATYPEEMASSVYGNLMECIGNLRELVFIKSKRANIQEHKNDIKPPPTMVH